MIVVSGTIVISPDKVERGRELTAALVAATRAEPGNVGYGFYADLDDPARYHVFEEWESEEAIQAHMASEHMAAFMAAAGELGISHLELHRYEVSEKRQFM